MEYAFSAKIREIISLSLFLSRSKNIMEVENNVCLRERERFTDSFRWKCKKASHLLMVYDVLIKMNYDVDIYIYIYSTNILIFVIVILRNFFHSKYGILLFLIERIKNCWQIKLMIIDDSCKKKYDTKSVTWFSFINF